MSTNKLPVREWLGRCLEISFAAMLPWTMRIAEAATMRQCSDETQASHANLLSAGAGRSDDPGFQPKHKLVCVWNVEYWCDITEFVETKRALP
eukprot:4154593-Amphidinium_carterae.1